MLLKGTMNIEKKIKLEQLKKKQKEHNFIKETERVKLQIINEIPSFHDKYSFISEDEIERVNMSLCSLPLTLGLVPDFDFFENVNRFEPIEKALGLNGNAWCKFASGAGNNNEIMIYGSIHSFIEDIHHLLPYGSPLYLLCENKQDIIFIDWHTHAIKASIPKL